MYFAKVLIHKTFFSPVCLKIAILRSISLKSLQHLQKYWFRPYCDTKCLYLPYIRRNETLSKRQRKICLPLFFTYGTIDRWSIRGERFLFPIQLCSFVLLVLKILYVCFSEWNGSLKVVRFVQSWPRRDWVNAYQNWTRVCLYCERKFIFRDS